METGQTERARRGFFNRSSARRDPLLDPAGDAASAVPHGLVSRTTFFAVAERTIHAAESRAQPTILVLDIDDFRELNHSLGYSAGDEVLVEVGARLVTLAGPIDGSAVSRLSSDEFAMLLPDAAYDDASALANRVVNELRRPLDVNGVKISLDAAIGIAHAPRHGSTLSELLAVAERAMLRAAETKTGVAWGTLGPSSNDTPQSRLVLMGDLGRAIDEEELQVQFQPKMKLADRSIHGVEALVRWPHPIYGFISPAEFVVAAEQTGQIHDLTRYVLNASLKQCRTWLEDRLEIRVAVNVSTRNLLDPKFVDTIRRSLEKNRVRGEYLVLEITEGTLMQDPERGSAAIERIRELGVEIALDDFGTGFSSLSYLTKLPFDELKIDRSFLAGITEGSANVAIIRAAVAMSSELGLRVVVEGIETEEELAVLIDIGCEIGQGYLFSRPVPGGDIAALVAPKMRFGQPRTDVLITGRARR